MALEHPYPIINFRFALEIGGATVGLFTECSGVTIEREVKAYPEGGVNDYVHQLPGRIKHSNITLKRGLANNDLWKWLQQGLYDGQVEHRHVSVVLFGTDLTEAHRWDLPDAYPGKWTGPDLKSGGNEIALETLELVQDGTASLAGSVQRTLAEETGQTRSTAQNDINLQALADKVYTLLKQELRIERERLG